MNRELLVKNINNLCKERNIAISTLEKDLSFGAGLISRWKDSDPSIARVVAVADYFNVPIDWLIGRENYSNDAFLLSLINMTEQKELEWKVYDNNTSAKQFLPNKEHNFKYLEHKISYKSYYSKYSNGYISIFAFYSNISKPEDIKLFIQPDDDSELITQEYKVSSLLPLWLIVLNHIENDEDAEVKAANMRQKISSPQFFISYCSQNTSSDKIDWVKTLNKNKKENFRFISNQPQYRDFVMFNAEDIINFINSPETEKFVDTINALKQIKKKSSKREND